MTTGSLLNAFKGASHKSAKSIPQHTLPALSHNAGLLTVTDLESFLSDNTHPISFPYFLLRLADDTSREFIGM